MFACDVYRVHLGLRILDFELIFLIFLLFNLVRMLGPGGSRQPTSVTRAPPGQSITAGGTTVAAARGCFIARVHLLDDSVLTFQLPVCFCFDAEYV